MRRFLSSAAVESVFGGVGDVLAGCGAGWAGKGATDASGKGGVCDMAGDPLYRDDIVTT
jgi:hypothetical protein